MDQELERFKTDINLVDYLGSKGYAVDKDESSRVQTVLRNQEAKIGVLLSRDGHWIFYDYRTDKGGSIIDFEQSSTGKNLGEVRKELRPLVGGALPILSHAAQYREPVQSKKNRQKMASKFSETKILKYSRYLENDRGIERETLASDRFYGTVRIDKRMNICFPHRDHEGISGFEKKNKNFSGFSSGGERTLWFSKAKADDTRIVICESGVDALSYYQLKDDGKMQYCRVGGQVNRKQVELIKKIVSKNQDKEITLAFDNDQAGKEHTVKIQNNIPEAKNLKIDIPTTEKDWNEKLIQRQQEIGR